MEKTTAQIIKDFESELRTKAIWLLRKIGAEKPIYREILFGEFSSDSVFKLLKKISFGNDYIYFFRVEAFKVKPVYKNALEAREALKQAVADLEVLAKAWEGEIYFETKYITNDYDSAMDAIEFKFMIL